MALSAAQRVPVPQFPRWAELLTQQQLADIGAVLQADHERASREPHYCQDRMVELLHNLPAGTFKEAPKREQPTRSGGTSMDCWTLSHSGMEAAWHLEGPGHDMLWVEVHPGMPPGMAMVSRQPNGSTQCRGREQQWEGYTIIAIPYDEFNRLDKSTTEFSAYLLMRLADAENAWLAAMTAAAAKAVAAAAHAAARPGVGAVGAGGAG
jgi:hypothetical protein